MSKPKQQTLRHRHILTVTTLILFVILMHWLLFLPFTYRGDEAWRVHFALLNTSEEIIQDMALNGSGGGGLDTPFAMLVLRHMAILGGHFSASMRHFMALLSVLTLALVYRLTADLFGHAKGRVAVVTVGLSPFTFYYIRDVSPYPLLMLFGVSSTYFLYRYLRNPKTPGIALGYIVVSVFGVFSHYFMVFVILGHALYILLFLRWNFSTLLRCFILFGVVGVTFFLGWGWITLNLLGQYNSAGYGLALRVPTVAFLLIAALIGGMFSYIGYIFGEPNSKCMRTLVRIPKGWELNFLIAPSLLALSLAVVMNEFFPIITFRNLLGSLPLLYASIAVGFTYIVPSMPKILARGSVILLIVGVLVFQGIALIIQDFRPFHFTQHINEYYLPESKFIINSNSIYRHILLLYYVEAGLARRVSLDDVVSIGNLENQINVMPILPDYIISDDSPETYRELLNWLDDAEQVWYFEADADIARVHVTFDNLLTDLCEVNRIEPYIFSSRFQISLMQPCT